MPLFKDFHSILKRATHNPYHGLVKHKKNYPLFIFSTIQNISTIPKHKWKLYDSIQTPEFCGTIISDIADNMATVATDDGEKLIVSLDSVTKIWQTLRPGATLVPRDDLVGLLVIPGYDYEFTNPDISYQRGIITKVNLDDETYNVRWECIGHYDEQTFPFEKGFSYVRIFKTS